jgi:hypothetical protein
MEFASRELDYYSHSLGFLGLLRRDCSCWIDILLRSCKICHATPPPLLRSRKSFRLEVPVQECDGAALGRGVLGRTPL